jgi:hypothetical protein
MEWGDVEATLTTDTGRKMAMDYFKEDLPLHMAVERMAPDSTILSLLNVFPDAAARAGRLGGTPLHLAAQQNLSPSIIVAFIRACPEVLDQEDDNGRLACDYVQRNELSREALCRPTACWIEDVEKEEYNGKIQYRKAQLRQKIQKLSDALNSSKQRRGVLSKYVQQLEPRLQTQRNVLGKLVGVEKQMSDLYDSNQGHFGKVRERIKLLSDEVAWEPNDEETMMKALKKRTYMQGVQRQYEKLIARTDQINKELPSLRDCVGQRRGSDTNQGRDDESI